MPYRIWKDEEGFRDFEINISANFLNRPVEEIVATLLHEMCHQFAYVNNIKDTCRKGYYHNKEFRKIALEHGLCVQETKLYGYNQTQRNGYAIQAVAQMLLKMKLAYRKLTEEDLCEEAMHDMNIEAKAAGVDILLDKEKLEKELQCRVADKVEKAKQREKVAQGSTHVQIADRVCGRQKKLKLFVDIAKSQW